MKTRRNLVFTISLIVALFVGYLIGTIAQFPSLKENELAGTFTKAEKFRKVKMTAKDIELRNELVKDSVKLKSTLQGLIYFSLFTEDLRTNLDLGYISFKAKGMGALPGDTVKTNVFRDFSDFIRTNNVSLNATIEMLSKLYSKGGIDASLDIENTLHNFNIYVDNLNKKDSALHQVLKNMDEFLLGSGVMKDRGKEFAQLKTIRDQLLVKGIQLSQMLRNQQELGALVKYALATQVLFDQVVPVDIIGINLNKPFGLYSNEVSSKLNNVDQFLQKIDLRLLPSSITNQSIKLFGLTYNSQKLHFDQSTGDQLKLLLSENLGIENKLQVTSQLNLLLVSDNGAVGILLSEYTLSEALKLELMQQGSALGEIIPALLSNGIAFCAQDTGINLLLGLGGTLNSY